MGKFWLVFSISVIGLILLVRNACLFFSHRKAKDSAYQILTVFLILDAVNETICNITGLYNPGSNYILSHTHYHLLLILGSLFYFKLFSPKLKAMVVSITSTAYIVFIAYYSMHPKMIFQISPVETFVISIILSIYALCYIYQTIDTERMYFNFSIGLIMYLMCSSVVYFSGHLELILCKNPYIDIWVFNSVFFIIFQLLIYKDWKILNAK